MVYDEFDRFKSILSSGWRGMMRCSLFKYILSFFHFSTPKKGITPIRNSVMFSPWVPDPSHQNLAKRCTNNSQTNETRVAPLRKMIATTVVSTVRFDHSRHLLLLNKPARFCFYRWSVVCFSLSISPTRYAEPNMVSVTQRNTPEYQNPERMPEKCRKGTVATISLILWIILASYSMPWFDNLLVRFKAEKLGIVCRRHRSD